MKILLIISFILFNTTKQRIITSNPSKNKNKKNQNLSKTPKKFKKIKNNDKNIKLSTIFSTLSKPLPKISLKPLKRIQKAKKLLKDLKKKKSRMNMLSAAIDMIQVPSYKPVSLIQAFQIPQISDSRIKVLTVNPPSKPILPGMLPNPHFKMNLEIPENEPEKNITKDINLVTGEKLEGIVSKIVKKSFLRALSKVRGKEYINKKNGIFRINVFGSGSQRLLDSDKIRSKSELIEAKLNRVLGAYESFGSELEKKLGFLDFAIKEYYGVKLNYVLK